MIPSKDWIPHNLPPRSEFIGREEAKALVHEALRSRSYLISIDGIGGIGKTSLALEAAYECLQVSQYVRQLNQTTSAPEPVVEQEVLNLPPQLYNRLQTALLKCGPFDSEVELRAMFVDARINPWRDTFPEVRNRVSRVIVLIDELLHRYATTGENALLFFLQVLKEQVPAGDTCNRDLATLTTELEHVLKDQKKVPDRLPEPPYLPPSLDVQKIARFEGFIWATAKDRNLSLNDLLDVIARTMDYPGIAQKPLEEKHLAVEKFLRRHPYLLVVDNFETISDEAVYSFLLNLPEPSKALITTREQKLNRVWAISLKGLIEDEAVELMRNEGHRVGMVTLAQAPNTTLLQLYKATGGIPLAIKWAIGQIKQKGQSLDAVLIALHGATGDIFDHIFGRSWDLLSEDARRVLELMSLFATSASYGAIEAVSNIQHFALDNALGQLVEMSLLEATDELALDQRRYGLHPLTRAFASTKLAEKPQYARYRLTKLLSFTEEMVSKFGGSWDQKGFALLDLELPNILEVISLCWTRDTSFILKGLYIFSQIADYLINRGYWDKAIVLGQQAIELSEKINDERQAALFKVWPVSCILRHRGNLNLAEVLIKEALPIIQHAGDERAIAGAKRNLGRVYEGLGQVDDAEKLLRQALEYVEQALKHTEDDDHRLFHSLVAANLGNVLVCKRELAEAWDLCSDAYEKVKPLGDSERISH